MFIGGVSSRERLAKLGVPILRFSNGVPVGVPSSGTFGDNGELTLTTAIYMIVSRYCYFPANAIDTAGSAAGLYWTVFSDTTHAIVYDNMYTGGGEPTIPTSLVPFACTGPGAYTQTTGADITVASFTLPGGSLGNTGCLTERYRFSHANTGGIKTLKSFIGSSQYALAFNLTTGRTSGLQYTWHNAGAPDIQTFGSGTLDTTVGSANNTVRNNIDLSVNQTFSVTVRLNAATDFIFLIGCDITTRYNN